jgi:catechol 2,3-dioxygenase-like lactoylglutathione lyase family enzyme
MAIIDIHHIQLAMPPGEEESARFFYIGILGFEETPKPSNLVQRGGVWFRSNSVHLHLGIEVDFRPAKKTHPAFVVDDLETIEKRCTATGYSIVRDEPIPGYDRMYVTDPFGNRIELLQKSNTG